MLSHLLLIASLLGPTMSERTTCVSQGGTAFRRVALNGSAAARTFVIENPLGAYSQANVELTRTRVAGEDFTLTCKQTTGTAAPTAVRGRWKCNSSGTCTLVVPLLSSTADANEEHAIPLDIYGWTRTACTVASTSAGATDFVTCVQRLVTQ